MPLSTPKKRWMRRSSVPVLTLVDSVRIEELLESVRRLVETQIREADVVLINKVDASTPEKIKKAVDLVKGINPTAEIMYGSGQAP